MKIKVNTARSYNELPKSLQEMGLFENNRSATDVKKSFDLLLDTVFPIELVTLHDELLNIIGIYIEKGKLKASDIVIDIYKNGECLRSVKYDEEGYLDENWILGLLDFEVE